MILWRRLCALALPWAVLVTLAVGLCFNVHAAPAQATSPAQSSTQPQQPPSSAPTSGLPGCTLTAIPPRDPRTEMFDSRQEMELGDIVAEQVQHKYLVIDDDDVTGNLRRIGAKLLANAPQGDFAIRFFVYDFPEANALTLPGGRIYVSRKLIAMTRNEDELASVLGHELGHALTHQSAMQMTLLFREVLGVTEAGSRDDIFHNYELLEDSVVTKKKVFARVGGVAGDEKQDQLVADQVGMQLVVKAGYAAQAFPDFFDRLAQTKGKTGGWLTDLFGATRPDSRRLREMLKQVAALPAACKTTTVVSNSADYQKWQSAVVNYSGLGHKEQLHEVYGKTKLDPPLQSDIRRLRVSPDGKYLLAQDESTIYVMTREPLASKFTIYAPDALPAKFTPDSQSIVFSTATLRVEAWSVQEEIRTAATEMVLPEGCLQADLSPDGKYLACFGREFDLAIYDVAGGELKFQKKNFSEPNLLQMILIEIFGPSDPEGLEIVHMHFSPDARYFLAHGNQDNTVALDLDGFRAVPLPGSVRALMWSSFSFVGPDKLAGVDSINAKNSALVKFPSGELIRKYQFGNCHIQATTDGHHVVLLPIKDHAAGLMDLDTGTLLLASDKPAFDAYAGILIHERVDGDLSMISLKDSKEISKVKLPLGQLGYLRTASVSPDLHWLAISEKSRGGLWDLRKGERVFYTRGFNGATVSTQGVVDADFAKFANTNRSMARMDAIRRTIDQGKEIADDEVWQFGTVLLRTTRRGKDWKLRNRSVEGLDAASYRSLWTRDFPKEAPRFASDRSEGRLVFAWPANSDGAKLEIKNDPALAAMGARLEGGSTDYFLEVVDPLTGKTISALVVRTGKRAFHLKSAESSGDFVVAEDSKNRLLVYSLATGEQTGILFGRNPVISAPTSLLAAQNERGQLLIYDLKTMTRRQEYFFNSRIAYTYFAADNRRIFVLTGDQTAYFLKIPAAQSAAAQ